VSKISEFTDNEFWSILDDTGITKKSAKRVVLCSGKVYYDLKARREENGIRDTALIRIEQFYPLNHDLLKKVVGKYPKDAKLVWCQEEPKNMGAWSFLMPRLMEIFDTMPRYVGRDEAASPAVGSLALHKREQSKLVKEAFEA